MKLATVLGPAPTCRRFHSAAQNGGRPLRAGPYSAAFE